MVTITLGAIAGVGFGQLREWIVTDLQSYTDLLLPLCFVAFFIGTAIALAFNQ